MEPINEILKKEVARLQKALGSGWKVDYKDGFNRVEFTGPYLKTERWTGNTVLGSLSTVKDLKHRNRVNMAKYILRLLPIEWDLMETTDIIKFKLTDERPEAVNRYLVVSFTAEQMDKLASVDLIKNRLLELGRCGEPEGC